MGRLSDSLRDAVRKMAYATSVDSLKRKGVNKVNVLGLDRIAYLIQEAVKRSLRYKMMAMDRAEVATATKDEFLKLLKSSEDLSRSHDDLRRSKDEAEGQVDELRRQLAAQEALLKSQIERSREELPSFEIADAQIMKQVKLALSDIPELSQEKRNQLKTRLQGMVLGLVSEERESTIQAKAAARDNEVEQLQRRIHKLNESLHQSEHQLKEMSHVRSLDDGISSIYKDVQGLSEAEKLYDRKKSLMSDIFAANLALRKRLNRSGHRTQAAS